MAKVVLYGLGKMAELAYFYLTNDSQHEIVAFTVDVKFIKSNVFMGLPVISFEEIEKHYPPDRYQMFIAVGYTKLNTVRKDKYYAAKNKGYKLISYICSKLTHWEEPQIGDNCFIFENQVIQPFVKIGNNVIIWSGNHFGHNVIIGDHCFIASHVVVCGGVTIGESSFVGVNATIRDDIKIGKKCILGAGSLILHDTKDKEVYIEKSTDVYRLNSAEFERMVDISNRRYKS